MGTDVNSELSTMAKAFPGNTESVPTFVEDDELFKTAPFEIYKDGYPANEFRVCPSPKSSCASSARSSSRRWTVSSR